MRPGHLVSALALLLCSVAAHADPVTYTLSGTFSGTLGTAAFTDAKSVFTFNGDTSGITDLGGGYYIDTAGVSTITLAGLGTATFLSPTFGVESEYNAAGFYDGPASFGIGTYSEAIANYNLSAPYGPVTGFLATIGPFPEQTSLGDLTITAGGDTTFQATTVTPEPGSLLLLGTGAMAFAGALRHRSTRHRATVQPSSH